MGFADTMTTTLFLNRRRSDIEFKIQAIMQRQLATLDQCNQISELLSSTVFQGDNTSAISSGNMLPGLTPNYSIVTLPGASGVPTAGSGGTAVSYEHRLAVLQGMEKELDARQKKLEIELEAIKAEQESMKKIADDHAKKDFKSG